MAITVDDKLNIIIVLLVMFLGYVMIGREGYADVLKCQTCLNKLDTTKNCSLIGSATPTGCSLGQEAIDFNNALLASKVKYGSNTCDNYTGLSCTDSGVPAPPRGDCTPATQFVYVHNEDGSIYTDEFGSIVPQEAQCPEKNAVVDKQVSEEGEESLYTYKCCPL
jgi:hypothetical protein